MECLAQAHHHTATVLTKAPSAGRVEPVYCNLDYTQGVPPVVLVYVLVPMKRTTSAAYRQLFLRAEEGRLLGARATALPGAGAKPLLFDAFH